MKKTFKLVSILMVAMMILSLTTPVFAATNATVGGQNITITDPTATNDVLTIAGKVLGFLQWVAIIGGTVIIAVLGVKYMMGSLEEKADYKKSMIPLIIGIVVVMAATTIANLLISTFKI